MVELKLYYATNRNHIGNRWHPKSYGTKFSNDGMENLRFGLVRVSADDKIISKHLTTKMKDCGVGSRMPSVVCVILRRETPCHVSSNTSSSVPLMLMTRRSNRDSLWPWSTRLPVMSQFIITGKTRRWWFPTTPRAIRNGWVETAVRIRPCCTTRSIRLTVRLSCTASWNTAIISAVMSMETSGPVSTA